MIHEIDWICTHSHFWWQIIQRTSENPEEHGQETVIFTLSWNSQKNKKIKVRDSSPVLFAHKFMRNSESTIVKSQIFLSDLLFHVFFTFIREYFSIYCPSMFFIVHKMIIVIRLFNGFNYISNKTKWNLIKNKWRPRLNSLIWKQCVRMWRLHQLQLFCDFLS